MSGVLLNLSRISVVAIPRVSADSREGKSACLTASYMFRYCLSGAGMYQTESSWEGLGAGASRGKRVGSEEYSSFRIILSGTSGRGPHFGVTGMSNGILSFLPFLPPFFPFFPFLPFWDFPKHTPYKCIAAVLSGVYLGAWPALLGASQASVEVQKCLECDSI